MTSTIQSMNDTKSGFKRYSVSNCWLLLILWSGIDIRLQEKSAFMGGSNYHQSGHFQDVGWHTTIKQFIWETHQPGHLVKQNYCAQHSPTRVGRNWVYHQVREMRENLMILLLEVRWVKMVEMSTICYLETDKAELLGCGLVVGIILIRYWPEGRRCQFIKYWQFVFVLQQFVLTWNLNQFKQTLHWVLTTRSIFRNIFRIRPIWCGTHLIRTDSWVIIGSQITF